MEKVKTRSWSSFFVDLKQNETVVKKGSKITLIIKINSSSICLSVKGRLRFRRGGSKRSIMKIPKDAFVSNGDGSWTVVKPVNIQGPSGSISLSPGMTFREGVQFMGIDIAKILNGS